MIETPFSPFPVLDTDRLILRQLEITDDEAIFNHRSDNHVNTYLEDFRHSSVEQTQAFIKRVQDEIAKHKTILWVLNERGHNRFIGTICFWNISKEDCKAETGYTLVSDFHGLGYMNEALVKVIDFGFKRMKLKTIEAYTHRNNTPSIKLLVRNHFQQGVPQKPVSNNRVFFSLHL